MNNKMKQWILTNAVDFTDVATGEFNLTQCEEELIAEFNLTRTGDGNDVEEIDDFEFKLYKFAVDERLISQ